MKIRIHRITVETSEGLKVAELNPPLVVDDDDIFEVRAEDDTVVVKLKDSPAVAKMQSRIGVFKCDAPGCTNPALDHTTQIAPATNVRVCAACAEAL